MNTPVESVPVIQADRDAAAVALGYRDWDDATDYRLTGDQDRLRDEVVQAFARHRTNQVAKLVEALEDLVRNNRRSVTGPEAAKAWRKANTLIASHKGEQQ